MVFGKELPYSLKWYKDTYKEAARQNVCSPLLFTNLFNTTFFIEEYTKNSICKFSDEGISTNQENKLLNCHSFFTKKDMLEDSYEQYNIFETNAKFAIPEAVIKDIWIEKPNPADYSEYGEIYIYLICVLNNSGAHKQAVLQTNRYTYILDTNVGYIQKFEHSDFLNRFPYNKIENVSVLQNPYNNKWFCGKLIDFKHLIDES